MTGGLPAPLCSRTKAGPFSFGIRGRLYLTLVPAVVLLYGWWSIIGHWGSSRMLFDLLWVPATTVILLVCLRDVWAKSPTALRTRSRR